MRIVQLPALLPSCRSPNRVMNDVKQDIVTKLYERGGPEADRFLVSALIHIAAALKAAAEAHEVESNELLAFCDEFEDAAYETMFSTTMDYPENVTKVLRPVRMNQPASIKSEVVMQAEAFFEGPLCDCIRFDLTKMLSTAQVVTFVHSRFYGCLHICRELPVRSVSDLFQVRSGICSYRYAPYTMFFFEAGMKLVFATLVAVHVSSLKRFDGEEVCDDSYTKYLFFSCSQGGIARWEWFIYLFTITSAIYELGEILHKSRAADDMTDVMAAAQFRIISALSHVFDRWNMLDVLTLLFIGIWSLYREASPGFSHASLNLAAITLCLATLRFYTLSQHAGQLMLMVFEILKDLRSFVLVLVSCLLGFGIVFRCLFSETAHYRAVQDTLLTLVDSALGEHEFGDFKGSSQEGVGIGLMIFYKILVAVVILNLIVARMSATHDNINENSLEVWAKLQAVNTQQFTLLRERNLFCVLPAPLNVLSVAAGLIEQVQQIQRSSQRKKQNRILIPNKGKRLRIDTSATATTDAVPINSPRPSSSPRPTLTRTPSLRFSPRNAAKGGDQFNALTEVLQRQASTSSQRSNATFPSVVSATADRVVALAMAPLVACYEVYLLNMALIQAPVPRYVPMACIAMTLLQGPVFIIMYFFIILWCVIMEPMPLVNERTREIQFHDNLTIRKCFSLPERRLAVLFVLAHAVWMAFLWHRAPFPLSGYLLPVCPALCALTTQLIDGSLVRDSAVRKAVSVKKLARYNNLQTLVRRACKERLSITLSEKEYLHILSMMIHTVIVRLLCLCVPRCCLCGVGSVVAAVYLFYGLPPPVQAKVLVEPRPHPVMSSDGRMIGTAPVDSTIQQVVPVREMKLDGWLLSKFDTVNPQGIMSVKVVRADLRTKGKTPFQRSANPYAVVTYPTQHGNLVQYTDTKKGAGYSVMWSRGTCKFALEEDHHEIMIAIYDRIDTDSDDATLDELLCWTEKINFREWVANRRFEGDLPLYDLSGKLPDTIQLDVKIAYGKPKASSSSGGLSSKQDGSTKMPAAEVCFLQFSEWCLCSFLPAAQGLWKHSRCGNVVHRSRPTTYFQANQQHTSC